MVKCYASDCIHDTGCRGPPSHPHASSWGHRHSSPTTQSHRRSSSSIAACACVTPAMLQVDQILVLCSAIGMRDHDESTADVYHKGKECKGRWSIRLTPTHTPTQGLYREGVACAKTKKGGYHHSCRPPVPCE